VIRIWRVSVLGTGLLCPKLSATDIIALHESKLITQSTRYNLGFDWYRSDENVYENFIKVRDHQRKNKEERQFYE
jgi:hypothetical protein